MATPRIGRSILRERRLRGWSQRDLERRTKVSQSEISAIEIGKRPNPKWKTVIRLARALGLSLDLAAGLL